MVQTTVEPVILSASRATDIPAFYAEWFYRRLQAGYFLWQNPFRPSQIQRVSTARTKAVVFWSKHPAALWPYLEELDRRGLHYYFQYTLNPYDDQNLEPGLPPLKERLALFRRLARRLGRERVIWRLDPLILTPRLDLDTLLTRARQLFAELAEYTARLVFSFVDLEQYPAARRQLARHGIAAREFTTSEMRDWTRGLVAINRPYGLELTTCAEKVDLTAFGIVPRGCVDGDLLRRLWPEDSELMAWLHKPAAQKDRGQRPACHCWASKDIGGYGTCPMGCRYCYATPSPSAAQRRVRAHRCENPRLC